jgi:hypothetical protein
MHSWRLSLIAVAAWLVFAPQASRADAPTALAAAIDRWAAERDHWAFTQTVREYDGDKLKEQRIERFDPSRPDAERWTLLQIDGRAPTEREISAFRARKGARKKHAVRTPGDLIDFGAVTVDAENDSEIRYLVPLRSDISLFVPTEKFVVEVTINKRTQAIEHVSVGLRAPVRIALGIARVSVVNFELDFPRRDEALPPDPAHTQPEGRAAATMFKFGTRMEFEWSDFQRVN